MSGAQRAARRTSGVSPVRPEWNGHLLDLVAHLASALAVEWEESAMVEAIVSQTGARLGAAMVLVHLRTGGDGAFQLTAQAGLPERFLPTVSHWCQTDGADAVIARASREQQSQFVDFPAGEVFLRSPVHDVMAALGCRSLIAVPLSADDDPIGVLTYARAGPQVHDADEIDALQGLGQLIARCLLRARRERRQVPYRAIVETAQDGILAVDADTMITFANERMAEMLGYTVAELTGRSAFDLVAPEDRPSAIEKLATIRDGRGENFEFRLRHKLGGVLWTLVSASKLADGEAHGPGALGVFTDITARREAEEALRRTTESLLLAQRIAHVGNWDWNIVTNEVHWSDEIYRIFGKNPQQFGATYDAFLRTVHPDDRAAVHDAVERVLRDPRIPYRVDHRVLRDDGTERHVHGEADVMCDADGNAIRMVGTVHDVTEMRRAEQARAHLAAIVTSSPDAIVSVDLSGRIRTWNPGAERLFGYTASEAIGRPSTLLRNVSEHGEPGQSFLQRALRGETVVDAIGTRRHKSGRMVRVAITAAPVRDDAGRITHVLGIARDVTEQLRIEREREELLARVEAERSWLQTVIDHSPIGILLFEGADGGKIRANRRASELLGRTIDRDSGIEQYLSVVHDANGEPMRATDMPSQRALRGEIASGIELQIALPGGRWLPVEYNAAPIRDSAGRILGAVVLIEDVSARKELERMREEWISIIAHDLRQPVTTISAYAAVLARRAPPDSPTAKSAGHIVESVRRLDRMISDLLEFSRLEAERLDLRREETDVVAMVRAILERMAPLARERPLRLVVHGPIPSAFIDAQRIEQVLANLISNAVKYGTPGTAIRIEIGCRNDALSFAVINQGRGITADELPGLFERFRRTADARASAVHGLGLGLYITRALIEAHGGRIRVTSEPGRETAFCFTLPIGATV